MKTPPVFPKSTYYVEGGEHHWFVLSGLLLWVIGIILMVCMGFANAFTGNEKISRWAPDVKREAQFIYGINAPVAMFLGQIKQESGGDEKVTASDGGMGLTQFMKGTVEQVVRSYPELGPASPYSPVWAIRAQIRFMDWNRKRVKGVNVCEQFGAALKAYNAGLGYPQRAQKKSETPDIWFGKTEYINPGQSPKNFVYSQKYPRWILFKYQPQFAIFGGVICDIKNPPIDMLPMK